MVIHVGIDAFFGGYIAAYNDITKEIIEFKAAEIDYMDKSINKVNKICKKIQATLLEEFGCACIFVPEYYPESYRKEFINNGLQIGFKKVFIIGELIGIYFDCIIDLKEKPSIGDIFWIFAGRKLVIWEKTEKKSKIIQYWRNVFKKYITESDLLFYKKVFGADKNPNMMFLGPCDYYEFSEISEIVKTVFSDCKFILYNSDFKHCQIALIKARIAANDQDLDAEIKNCDINNFTESKIKIWIALPSGDFDKEPILYLNAGQPLPFEKTMIIPVESNQDILKIKFLAVGENYYPEKKITPEILNVGEISFTLKIDENGIVSYDFTVIETLGSTQRRVNNFFANQKKQDTIYNIPQKDFINNVNINAVGIDLGMTRCSVAVNRRNRIELVAIDNEKKQLPSYVSFKEKDPICGQLVINQLETYANASVFDIKRIIGRNFDEIQIHSSWPFEVIKNDINKPLLRVQSCECNMEKHPEEISAILLKHIKQRVEEFQGKILDEVVITIPAGFNKDQKIATHVAADLAGFKTVHLLEEPIAASIAYFVDCPIPPTFNMLLFDLGGGTLDLCIFKVEKSKFKVIAYDGDSNLGGRDFDNILYQHFEKILETKYKIVMNERNKYRLMLKCVEIKHTLSIGFEATLDVSEINFEIDEFLTVTRQEFEQMASKLLDQIGEVLIQTFSKTNIVSRDINKVLLIGGGCRMPMIQLFLRKRFPKADHTCGENPDEMVAIGAAYYSSFLMSKNNSSNCNIM